MRQRSTVPGTLAVAALGAVAFLTLLFAAGCARYGSPAGVLEKVRTEVAVYRPHPLLVPTPSPAHEADLSPAGLAALAAAPISPTPVADGAMPAASAAPGPPQRPALPAATTASATTASWPTPPGPAAGATVAATPSPTSSPTDRPSATPSPTATPAFRAAAGSVALTGLVHIWQGWNNCGPATLAMNLSYYGSRLTQDDIGDALRPNKDDKNTSPEEMVAYARSQGFQATLRVNGDVDRLRLLLSNGVPVIVETWFEPAPNDGMGHYRLLTGYDDANRSWIAYDSYVSTGVDPKKPYAGIRISYADLDKLWPVFDRTYVVVYTADQAPIVNGIIGSDVDDATMWQRALRDALAGTQAQPGDAFAWFNLGTDLVGMNRFEQAAAAFDRARHIGLPWRMLWYQFGPFRAYYETGRYQEVVSLADATNQPGVLIEELFYWKGMAMKALGNNAGARAAWQQAIKLHPGYQDATQALADMGPQ